MFKANYAHASVRRNIGHASYFMILAYAFVTLAEMSYIQQLVRF